MSDRIYVAVGVIYSLDKKQVLISKRKAEQHLAGLWEFPGGKVEYKESVQSALKRELHEELGIKVISTSQLTTISYDYPDKKVLLDVWLVKEWSGKPESKENQQLAWVQIDNLTSYSFPEANKHIIQTLTLPSIYLVSPSSYENLTEFISTAEQCFIAGIKVFQLRLELIEEAEYLKLINKLSNLAKIYSVKLILNGKPRDIEKYSINGIHLKSKELFNYESRPVSEELLRGASCHNEKELLQAK